MATHTKHNSLTKQIRLVRKYQLLTKSEEKKSINEYKQDILQ